MVNQQHEKTCVELIEQIRDLVRSHRTLLARLSNAELLADDVALKLARLEEFLECGTLPEFNRPATGREKSQKREELRRMADSGASTLVMTPRSDGHSEIRIDAGKVFCLPPMLADVLSILSMGGTAANDSLVGWKTVDEVAVLLGKRTGRHFTKHAVTQSIYRLRREIFNRGGANPYLVQTNRRRGVRFALKQKSRL
jgi:hypothetical protein